MDGLFHAHETERQEVSNNPFAVARQYLWDGSKKDEGFPKERFLCHTVMAGRNFGKVSGNDCTRARDMIRSRLGEYTFLESWLANEAHVSINDLTHENVQAYRLRWLGHLEQLWNQGERN